MASTLSWQGRCGGSPINVADTMAAWGLSEFYDPNDPNTALYAAIVRAANPDPGSPYYQHATPTPQGLQGNGPANADTGAGWEVFTECCLRARVVLWAEKKIGDCGSGIQLSSVGSDVQLGVQLGTQGLFAGASIAGTTVQAILGPIASSLIPAVGALIAPLLAAFQAHSQAVAREEETLCSLTSSATQAIQGAYKYVQSGQATPAQGYATLQQLYAGFKAAGAGVTKSFCDGGCGLNATVQAHVALSSFLFGIVPAPSGLTIVTALPSPASSGLDSISDLFGASSSETGTSVSPFSLPTWAWVALAVLLVLVFMGGRPNVG